MTEAFFYICLLLIVLAVAAAVDRFFCWAYRAWQERLDRNRSK